MPTSILAAIAASQQVLLGEDNISFFGKVEIAVHVALLLQTSTTRVVRVGEFRGVHRALRSWVFTFTIHDRRFKAGALGGYNAQGRPLVS